MTLNKELREQIIQSVKKEPQSIQELALRFQKNWRTMDRYVSQIIEEYGVLSLKIFREGSRGSLKIVYHQGVEQLSGDAIRARLLQEVLTARHKKDFTAFDIYQHCPPNKRSAFLEKQDTYHITKKQDLIGLLKQAQKEVFIFSGNFTWIESKQGKESLAHIFEELLERGVHIRVLANVNLDTLENMKLALALNTKTKTQLLDIRHAWQPLRAIIIDDKLVRFKEEGYFNAGQQKKTYMFYELHEDTWITWMQQIFWKLFNASVGATQRIRDLESIQHIND